jgi:hypothetical protein
VTNTTLTRRQNALALFQAFAERTLASGGSPKGMEQSFAATLQISPSMWSQIKSSRPIGDKLARQIEQLGGKPRGWLDQTRDPSAVSPAEKAFMELALTAWRASNRGERKALRATLAAAFIPAAAAQAAPDALCRPDGPRPKPGT